MFAHCRGVHIVTDTPELLVAAHLAAPELFAELTFN
jgi:hypothetical protein